LNIESTLDKSVIFTAGDQFKDLTKYIGVYLDMLFEINRPENVIWLKIPLNIEITQDIVKITISIGGYIQTETSSSLRDAIHKADSALYESKHNGRNRVLYFDIPKSKILHREKLKDMIETDKLICFYQPIVSLKDAQYHHYEALLRIQDGDNIIYPDKILP